MRTAALIAAAAVAFTLSACNQADDAATDASTEAAEASGAAADTAAMTTEQSAAEAAAAANAPARSGSGSMSGETMAPGSGSMPADGAMAPNAQPADTAGNNVTETERRLNPPTTPAQ